MVITKPAIASRPEFETNPSNMLRMLKDILLDLCRIEEAKERLCWQGEILLTMMCLFFILEIGTTAALWDRVLGA